jgi:hypothetical protein
VAYYEAIQDAVREDSVHALSLGTLVEEQAMNEVQVHPGLAPVQMALVRIIVWLVLTQRAKVLIYSEPTHYLWKNTEEVLDRVHRIKVIHFSGTVQQLNRKRRRMENPDEKGVMFLPDNHVDGTNFGFVTHVLIVGKITNRINYERFLGRATRMGRIEPLTIIEIKPSCQ